MIEQKYKSYLEDKNIKLISFDIFDTLFFRRCGSYENIFIEMGRENLVKDLFYDEDVFKNYRMEFEKKAYSSCLKEEISFSEIYEYLPLTKEQKNKILKLELDVEKRNLILNKYLLEWIKLAKKYNKKVVLTSDMYLSLDNIKYVALNQIEDISLIDEFYISSEINLRKSTGKLFEYILEKNNLSPNEVLHIGDNINSDINIANAIGINTIYYNINKNFKSILSNEETYLKEHFIEKDFLRILPCINTPYKDEKENFFYTLGATIFGPILWEFSIWLKDIMYKENIEKINFFMREGYTFQKVFNLIFPEEKSQTVRISRESTNFLALDLDDIGKVNFNKFRNLSVEDYYDIFYLKIKDENINKIKNSKFKDLEIKENIIDDINSRKSEIEININKQHMALSQYFNNIGIKRDSSFVDFGGGGTVIERINDKFFNSNNEKIDILFFMHNEALKKSFNNRIIPFLPNNKTTEKVIEKIKRTPEFIEILLNGFNYSTYRYTQENSELKIIEDNKFKSEVFTKELKNDLDVFYSGIEAFIKNALFFYDRKPLYKKEYLLLLLSRVIALPTKNEAKFIGNLKHDEGSGSKNIYKLVDSKHVLSKNELQNLYLKYIKNPFKTQYKYPWLEGLITHNNSTLIKDIYGSNQTQNEIAIERIIDKIEEQKLKKISIYGAGELFENLYPYLEKKQIVIENLIDSRAKIKPFSFLGFDVKTLENTSLENNGFIVIASVVYYEEIKVILENHSSKVNII